MASLTAEQLEEAKVDPAAVFATPADVLTADLSKDEKVAILKRWEADADALLRAGDEGMGDEPQSAVMVQDVLAALESLQAE